MNYDVGKLIFEIRRKSSLTQAEFASELGLTPQAISKWENGLSSPDVETLFNLAHKYNISLDKFVEKNKKGDLL